MPRIVRQRSSQTSIRLNVTQRRQTASQRRSILNYVPVVRLERIPIHLLLQGHLAERNPRVVLDRLPTQDVLRHLHGSDLSEANSGERQVQPVARPTEVASVPSDAHIIDTRFLSTHVISQIQPAVNVLTDVPSAVPTRPRRRHAEVPHRLTYRAAVRANGDVSGVTLYHIGSLSDECPWCHAKFFTGETANRQGQRRMCCNLGLIKPLPLGPCPPQLRYYLTDEERLAVQFRTNIRAINSNFAMASFKATIPVDSNVGQGHWCFVVSGQIYHYAAPLPASQDLRQPVFNQVYFLDAAEAIDRRAALLADRVHPMIITDMETIMRRYNKYASVYRMMHEVISELRDAGNHLDTMVLAFSDTMRQDRRNFNLPESRSDIAAIYCGEGPPFQTDLKIYPRTERNQRDTELKNLNKMTDPMVYPVLFPHGEDGWHIAIPHTRGTKTTTLREYYRYRMQIRNEFSIMHHAGKLFQQYIVDGWCKAEGNVLFWLRQNQKKIRQTNPFAIRRLVEARRLRGEQLPVGNITILPTTFVGGPRAIQRHYLDAMTVVSRLGKPDLFVTFTCNPKWDEITANLEGRQQWQHRPDLIVRVFHQKLREFMDDVNIKQLYGVVIYSMYVIEFQKRGLPHAHILICLRPEDKLDNEHGIDSVVTAMLPDPVAEPTLFELVKEFNVHKPCGLNRPNAPCMKEGKCSKGYPKRFTEHTVLGRTTNTTTGQPIYRRPNDGLSFMIDGVKIDNTRVVPYNRYALMKFRCHINFELCGSLASIKYLHKYVHKGPDSVTVVARPESSQIGWDEIRSYLDCRYVSSMEAAWRIYEFHLSDRTHSVMVLPVHLPGEQTLQVDELVPDDQLLDAVNRPTKLTAYFDLNINDTHAATLKYAEIPEHYTWLTTERRWQRRRQVSKTLGCVAEVSPNNSELFHLRMLLCNVRGGTSFEFLLRYESRTLETFNEACLARGLLRNSDEYERALSDATFYRRPHGIRRLFALLLSAGGANICTMAASLWEDFRHHMMADFVYRGVQENVAQHAALKELSCMLHRINNTTTNHYGLPSVDENLLAAHAAQLIQYGHLPQPNEQLDTYQGDEALLNAGQKAIFEHVFRALEETGGSDGRRRYSNLIYIDAPGGTGKTFLFNSIIKYARSQYNGHCVAVAWTGIAASLLVGGKTAHRAFKIPINLNGSSRAGFPLEHEQSVFVREALVVIWDEASMAHRYAVEAVDRYLRDLMRSDLPMGGKVVVFGGDFRQTLPVIHGGHRTDVINATLKRSPLWASFFISHLSENLRAGLEQRQFSDWLLKLGDGRIRSVSINHVPFISSRTVPTDLIEIDADMSVATKEELVRAVFGDDPSNVDLAERVILCPTNASVREMNDLILDRLPAEQMRTYYSVDEYLGEDDDELHVPMDYVNSIEVAALPPHELRLRQGAVVMLLTNLDLDVGHCNGTRFKVLSTRDHLVELEQLTGAHRGEILLLPKLKLQSTEQSLPKPITRTQFPIKLAFAITINKSQGQTFGKVGLFLDKPCFAHGQLYVAFSRVRRRVDMHVYVANVPAQGQLSRPDGRIVTRNVVYNSIIADGMSSGDGEVFVGVDERLSDEAPALDDLFAAAGRLDEGDVQQDDLQRSQTENDRWLERICVPDLSTQQLAARVASGDRPGTSGLNLVAGPGVGRFTRHLSTSDEDLSS